MTLAGEFAFRFKTLHTRGDPLRGAECKTLQAEKQITLTKCGIKRQYGFK